MGYLFFFRLIQGLPPADGRVVVVGARINHRIVGMVVGQIGVRPIAPEGKL